MKKVIIITLFLLAFIIGTAQNVGIGITTPAELLHLYSTTGNVKIRLTSVADGARSGTEYATGGGTSDLSRFGLAAGSSTAGVSMNGNTRLYASGGSLLIGNSAAEPIYFATGNEVKMTLDGNGNLGIGIIAGSDRLSVASSSGDGISSFTSYVPGISNFTSAVLGVVSNTSERGHGLTGIAQNASGGSSGTIGGMYGVVGTATETGYGVGAFGTAGAGGIFSYVFSGSGKALRTFGAVQLEGIGAAVGRVLTSDAGGNASWQAANQHDHFGQVWTGSSTTTGLQVVNSNLGGSAAALRGNADGGGAATTRGVEGSSNSINGIGIFGTNNSGSSAGAIANVGVAGTAGTGAGVYGASLTGYSIFGFKSNNISHTGTVARFENQNASNTASVVQAIGAGPNPALEINNGFLKVAGTNKTAFSITATAGNSSGHILRLNYANQSTTDIVLVTHNYNPGGVGGTYHNVSVGVYWDGNQWTIYSEDTATPMLGKSFNVLVIKQ